MMLFDIGKTIGTAAAVTMLEEADVTPQSLLITGATGARWMRTTGNGMSALTEACWMMSIDLVTSNENILLT